MPLLAAGASGDLLWYAMPYIEGESLRVRLARQGDLPVKESIQMVCGVMTPEQVYRAVAALRGVAYSK